MTQLYTTPKDTASECNIKPANNLKSCANSLMCSSNPGRGSSGILLIFSVVILKACRSS